MSHFSSKWLKVTEPYPTVLLVELARAPVNAFNVEYWTAYGKLFDDIIEDGYDVRALVLCSSFSKIFTAGLDLKDASILGTENTSKPVADGARASLSMHKLIQRFQDAITKPEKAPFPVIAAVHGPVIGLGVDIMCACDIRYAAVNSVFAIKEVDIGLAADIGSLAYLPKITENQSLIRELAYTGRNFSAPEVEKLGFVSRIVPGARDEVVQAALELAKTIAQKSPIAISGTKRLITHARDHSVGENLVYTQSWNAHALMTNDMKENIIAMRERRPPRFAALKPGINRSLEIRNRWWGVHVPLKESPLRKNRGLLIRIHNGLEMPTTYTHHFDTATFKGDVTLNTGLFINGQWVDPVEGGTIDVIDPTTGKVITSVAGATSGDVDRAVEAAEKASKTTWGLKMPGGQRGRLISKLADLIEKYQDELSALEALNVGKTFNDAKGLDLNGVIGTLRYFAGWADKIHGKTIETTDKKMAYTRHEPFGVVGCIVPWNFPLMMAAWKLGPALATGNAVVLKPSEITPLTALRLADLVNEAGFPPGVLNILPGYGPKAGQAIAEHPKIRKVAFTGSTLTGRKILKAASETNLKVVTLELGGKSPTIIFDDADLDQTLKWAAGGIFTNMGQSCVAASRIFVQESIYQNFLEKFVALAQNLTDHTGSPFDPKTRHGPQVSQTQFDRVMGFINSGKQDGAKVLIGGERHGQEGYFVKPTVFTDVNPKMSIMQDEIFGPVCSVVKFKTEEGEFIRISWFSAMINRFLIEVLELANDVAYGLGANVFTENASRAIRVSNALEAGSVWRFSFYKINCAQATEFCVPFGGYKQSGIGRDLGQYALDMYTQVKGVHINIGLKL
ncbi:hypothetical protein NP233_g4765 [Leucocoprinus birnbaumii]|uniref:Aldehyde dehydrogenase domain-containing protein n=1 Tax=Leucocoprinus birnbaumii TaxID=56174 RepID=A0AAD5YX00_9AGAR|nr:hypothetical protein NP233_g4765 [Leucocoprinus birnbaumii]